jgi:hypothetical protein
MKHPLRLFSALAVITLTLPVATYAHFKLLEPASWIKEDPKRGDPQKVGPCGGDPKGQNESLITNAVTKVTGGSKFHLKIEETIFHPGHYRVALAVNSRNELPPDPMTFEKYTEKGVYSVWAAIQSPPQIPVIADGLFPHYTRPATLASLPPGSNPGMPLWEADIELPNISCAKCTLQVIQFMAEHGYNQPGGYSYHHCSDLQITADPSKPISKGWPTVATSN